MSQAIDGLVQSVFQLAKRQPVVDDRVRARNSGAGPTRLSRHGVSVKGAGDQLVRVASRVLKEMPGQDREILLRFYLHEEHPEDIQRALGITETQYRRVKSRAKSRFRELQEAEQRLRSKDESQG
ncbi:MAG: hypothetical protein ACLQKA_24695 [Bryobacteraceae bacterium]